MFSITNNSNAECVLKFPLDYNDYNGLTIVDESGYNNNGTRLGLPFFKSLGRCGDYLKFDGVDDYIEIENDASFDFTGNLTIAFCIKTTQDYDLQRDIIVTKSSAPNRWYLARVYHDKVLFQVYNDGASETISTGEMTVCNGEWHTLVCTYRNDSGLMSLYYDGILDNFGGYDTVEGFSVDSIMYIGKGLLSGGYFDGDLTNIYLFNTCLTPDESVDLHNLMYISYTDSGLGDDDMIEINEVQFVIVIQLLLLFLFLWIGCTIPAMEGSKRKLHYMPFSGGLFMIFGGIDFISFSLLITFNYSLGIIGGFLTIAGVILLIYGMMKAFYYE